jgi:hypothetical protein
MNWKQQLLEAIRRGSVTVSQGGKPVATAKVGAVRTKGGSIRTGMRGTSDERRAFAANVRSALQPGKDPVKARTDTRVGPQQHALQGGHSPATTVTKITPAQSTETPPGQPTVAPKVFSGRRTEKVTQRETNPLKTPQRPGELSKVTTTRTTTARPSKIRMPSRKRT